MDATITPTNWPRDRDPTEEGSVAEGPFDVDVGDGDVDEKVPVGMGEVVRDDSVVEVEEVELVEDVLELEVEVEVEGVVGGAVEVVSEVVVTVVVGIAEVVVGLVGEVVGVGVVVMKPVTIVGG
jgi:hypothetical protein